MRNRRAVPAVLAVPAVSIEKHEVRPYRSIRPFINAIQQSYRGAGPAHTYRVQLAHPEFGCARRASFPRLGRGARRASVLWRLPLRLLRWPLRWSLRLNRRSPSPLHFLSPLLVPLRLPLRLPRRLHFRFRRLAHLLLRLIPSAPSNSASVRYHKCSEMQSHSQLLLE